MLACEYSRLSSLPAARGLSRERASAIYIAKFHTDDEILSGIQTGALIGHLDNFASLGIKLFNSRLLGETNNMAARREKFSRPSFETFPLGLLFYRECKFHAYSKV